MSAPSVVLNTRRAFLLLISLPPRVCAQLRPSLTASTMGKSKTKTPAAAAVPAKEAAPTKEQNQSKPTPATEDEVGSVSLSAALSLLFLSVESRLLEQE